MWFNSTLSEEPHQGLKSRCKLQKWSRLRGFWTGAARLSSARHVNGSLKWGNERNPCRLLQVSDETARVDREEGGDDVKSAWPFDALGYTHDTMGSNNGLPNREVELIPESVS